MTLSAPRSTLAFTLLLLAVVAAGALPGQAEAEPRWVNDEIRVTFRAGPGDNFRIIRYFNTGARLETVTPPADRFPEGSPDGWTYLRDGAGNTGWVRDQYLVRQAPARVRIDAIVAERDQARETVASLRTELDAMRSDNAELTRQLAESESRIAELQARFAAAREGFELMETNQALELTVRQLREQNTALEREKRELSDRTLKEWFLIGAGVLAAGIIMGLILPSLRRKRDPWGSGGF